MKVNVLGPVVLTNQSDPVDLGGPRQQRLLAALALHANRVVSSEQLVEIVFGEAPPEGARTTLRSYIARLRSSLRNTDCPDAIVTRSPGYVLNLGTDQCDADEFASAVSAARTQHDAGGSFDAASGLRAALDLWRGEAYWEFSAEEWARAEAARLEELRAEAEELLIEAQMSCGASREVIPDLTRLVESHPFREGLRGQLMLAMYRAGRQTDALRSFEHYRRDLVDVGLEPGPDLVALEQGIARSDPGLDPEAAAGLAIRGYRTGGPLSEDRLGTNYRAIQPGIGRVVLLKEIRGSFVDSPSFIQEFQRLAPSLVRLEHPHIVPIYDFWREPSVAYLVTRILPTTLESLLELGPISGAQVATLIEQGARGLAAAHRLGLVHGCLQPSSVQLDEDGAVYLTDFGLGGLVDGAVRSASLRSPYQSPELLGGSAPTPASDQFALAAIVVRSLTGATPFVERGVDRSGERVRSVEADVESVPPALDRVLAKALASDPRERYPTIMDFAVEAVKALGGEVKQTPIHADIVNPFRGLQPFSEADAQWFFGREDVVEQLLSRCTTGVQSRFVTLVGASGSGKSSIVHAGLIPRLRDGAVPGSNEWLIATMVPGADPLAELDAALSSISVGRSVRDASPNRIERLLSASLSPDQTAVLFIDQLEELFTLTPAADGERFMDELSEVIREGRYDLRIVATLRADFYDRPLLHPDFGRLVTGNVVTVLAMTADRLALAVRQPALASGVEFDPRAVARIVADVGESPSSLPLLQFSLTELFDRREGAVIRLESYEALGGFESIVARRADEILDQLPNEQQTLVRQLFLLLVSIDPSGVITRHRVLRSEAASLGPSSAVVSSILERFGTARLLSFDRDPRSREVTVDIAHETLAANWPRLQQWVAEQGEGMRIRGELRLASHVWVAEDRDDSALYRGKRLQAAEEWARDNTGALTETERAFLGASVDQRTAEESALRAQRASDRRERRKVRRLRVGIAAVVLVAVIAGSLAFLQRGRAEDESQRAAGVALAAAAREQVDVDPELSLLLAAEAVRTDVDEPPQGALEALHAALLGNRLTGVIRHRGSDPGIHVTMSPDGSRLVTQLDDPTISQIWSTSALERLHELVGHEDNVTQAAFSEDGRLIATASLDGTVRTWDTGSGEMGSLLRASSPRPLFVPHFSPSSEVVAASGPGGVVDIWDIESGELLQTLPSIGGDAPWTFGMSFHPDGSRLAVVSNADDQSGIVTVWEWESGDLTLSLDGHVAAVSDVEYSPDGSTLFSSSWDGQVNVWDATTGSLERSFSAHQGGVNTLDLSDDGSRLATAGPDGVLVWDIGTVEVVASLRGHAGGVEAVTLGPGGFSAVTSSIADGTVRLWNSSDRVSSEVSGWPAVPTMDRSAAPPIGSVDISADSGSMILATVDRLVGVPILGDGSAWNVPGPGKVTDVVFGPDGSTIAAAGTAGVIMLDAGTGSTLTTFSEGPDALAVAIDPAGEKVAWAGRGASVAELEVGTVRALVPTSFEVSDIAFNPTQPGSIAVVRGTAAVSPGEEDLSASLVEFFDGDDLDPAGAISMSDAGGHTRAVVALAFDAEGRRLATASQDASVVLWDVESRTPTIRLEGHIETVNDVAFDPTSDKLATGSSDATLKIWDADTGAVLLTLPTHSAVSSIAYSPDGAYLIASDPNGATTTFIVDSELLVLEADRRSTRHLTPTECETYLPTLPCPSG